MSIAKMVREMIAKGVDPEMIELAVATVEVALSGGIQVDVAAEKRRAWDREYRRRTRPNPPESTRHPPDTENASLSKEDKKKENKEERGASQRVHPTRGQRLPEDWQPTPQDEATAHALIGPDRTRSELEKFRDHWKQQPGSKGVKLDWSAAWRNWIRRAAEYAGGKNGHGPRGPPRGPQGFETLFKQPENPHEDTQPRSEYDIDLTADRPH